MFDTKIVSYKILDKKVFIKNINVTGNKRNQACYKLSQQLFPTF